MLPNNAQGQAQQPVGIPVPADEKSRNAQCKKITSSLGKAEFHGISDGTFAEFKTPKYAETHVKGRCSKCNYPQTLIYKSQIRVARSQGEGPIPAGLPQGRVFYPGILDLIASCLEPHAAAEALSTLVTQLATQVAADMADNTLQATKDALQGFVENNSNALFRALVEVRSQEQQPLQISFEEEEQEEDGSEEEPYDENVQNAQEDYQLICANCGAYFGPLTVTFDNGRLVGNASLDNENAEIDGELNSSQHKVIANSVIPKCPTRDEKRFSTKLEQKQKQAETMLKNARDQAATAGTIKTTFKQFFAEAAINEMHADVVHDEMHEILNEHSQQIVDAVQQLFVSASEILTAVTAYDAKVKEVNKVTDKKLTQLEKELERVNTTCSGANTNIVTAARKVSVCMGPITVIVAPNVDRLVLTMQNDYRAKESGLSERQKRDACAAIEGAEAANSTSKAAAKTIEGISKQIETETTADQVLKSIHELGEAFKKILAARTTVKELKPKIDELPMPAREWSNDGGGGEISFSGRPVPLNDEHGEDKDEEEEEEEEKAEGRQAGIFVYAGSQGLQSNTAQPGGSTTTQPQEADRTEQRTGEPTANAPTKKRRTTKQRLTAVEGDVAELKGDVAGLKGDVAELKDRLTKVEGTLTKVEGAVAELGKKSETAEAANKDAQKKLDEKYSGLKAILDKIEKLLADKE